MPRKIYSSTELQIMRDGQHLLGGSYYGSNLGKDVFNKIGGSEYNTGDWTCVVFKASSTKSQYITFNTQINNINVLVVAGGGAGSSSPGGPSPTQGGGGGGGGGIFYSNSFPITIGKQYSINVGVGGVNLNSPNGGISSVSLDGTNIITATAGAGGGSTQSGGGGGLGSSTYSSTGGYPGGTGADGYDAAQWATFGPLPNGKSSGLVSITIPIETTTQNGTTSSTTNLYLSGGGGGACQYNPGGMYGGAGSGNGGISYNPDLSPPPNPSFRDACGKNSFKNNEGFGGGGGGTYAIGSPTILGGSGGAGVVIFWWKN